MIGDATAPAPGGEPEAGRLLLADSLRGKLLLLDSTSRRSVPLFDVAFDRPFVLGQIGLSRDGKTIFFLKNHTEADIWQATLGAPAADQMSK